MNQNKAIVTRKPTKKEIYASFGIEFDGTYIYCEPLKIKMRPVLKNGNNKIGRGVYQLSLTAGNAPVSDDVLKNVVKNIMDEFTAEKMSELKAVCGGTCGFRCKDCYGLVGHYVRNNVATCLARHTYLATYALGWLENAINAQIAADHIEYLRIHVTGDMKSREYAEMWLRIIRSNRNTCFWTYTKQYGRGFDDVLDAIDSEENANIVKSFTDTGKINFGPAGYIIELYKDLVSRGKSVWICKCGVDKNQHCNGCHHCFTSEYVLFLLHSCKEYNPKKDPRYNEFVALVNSQIETEEQAV